VANGDPAYGDGSGASGSAGLVPWMWGKDTSGALVAKNATREQVNAQLAKWFQGDTTDGITWPVLSRTLKAAGYSNDGSWGSVKKQWDALLNDTASMGGGTTVYSFLGQQVRAVQGVKQPLGGGAAAYNGPTSSTQITNEFDANRLMDEAMIAYVGETASAEFKKKYLASLNAAEKANPQVRTPNGKHDATYTGGFSSGAAQDLAKDFAVADDSYAETAANTTGLQLFEQAIKGESRMI